MKTLSIATLMVLACLCAGTGRAAEPTDAVAAQDRLQLKVLEWVPAKGEYREWGAVGGAYTVSPDQTITIPFVGTVSVAGRAVSALAGDIADALQRGLSLPTRPEVSIEVVARAPVYVLGGVETPGKIEFTPGLTALQAIAQAGGFYRGGGATMRLERDTINAESDLASARGDFARLKARIARLEAETSDEETIGLASLEGVQGVEMLVAEEQALLEVRRQARLSRLNALTSRRQLAQDQLKALDEQGANLDRQLELTRKQLANIQTLADKGLTVATRVFDLERTLSDLEGRRLDVQVSRLTTTLAINQTDRDQVDVQTEFQTEVANDLQSARADLALKQVEIARAQALLRESTIIAPEKLMDRAGNINIDVRIFLSRSTGGRPSMVEITQGEVLQAGDTIQVQMKPEDAPPAPAPEQTNAIQ